MKKILLFASAIACLFLAGSCQRENLEPVQQGNIVTYTVTVPDALATKGIGDITSNVNTLHYEVYRTAAAETVTFTDADRLLYHKTATAQPDGTFKIDLELVNDQNFTVLFWAQVGKTNEAYDVTKLTEVKLKSSINANQADYAAFSGVDFIKGTDALTDKTILLTRPVAQINLGTTEASLTAFDTTITLDGSSMTVTGLSNTFDVAKQAASGDLTSETIYAQNTIPTTDPLTVNSTGYVYVGMNYAGFAPEVGTPVTVSYGINTSEGLIQNTIENVPVKPNYRTNIVGNLITSKTGYTVTLDATWGTPSIDRYGVMVGDNRYENFNDAVAEALATGKPIDFFTDVEIDADETIIVPDDKNLKLNLNGYTLRGTTDDADKNDDSKITSADNEVMFDVRGTMEVNNGRVLIKHVGDSYADFAWNACGEVFYVGFGGTLIVKNATIENAGGVSMAYAIDMVNATNITLEVDNSTLKSSYIPVRVFNNGAGMNNVTITNSTLEGTSRAFWVHIFTEADDAKFFNNGKDTDNNGYKNETLNINIFNPDCKNVFKANNPDRLIEYGFTNEINLDEYGVILIKDAEGNIIEGVGMDLEGNYAVSAAEGLEWIAANVADNDGFAGKTVKLTQDIDCFKGYMPDGDPVSTQPIGQRDYTTGDNPIAFKGTFDGNNHAIKNLYQNGWALGYWEGQYGAIGLFARIEGATIKNLTMDGCEMFVERGNVAVIAGNAEGNCTFENITIKNSTVASYNNGAAGIVAWSETGNYTFKNIILEETFTVASLWGLHGAYLGGIIAEAYADCSYKLEDIVISCRLDAYNDVVSNYQWYAYRCDGMIVGNVETRQTIGDKVYPDPAGCNITCSNVIVNYGDWMNYHYCESPEFGKPSYAKEGEWKFHRVEPGFQYGGIEHTKCNHGENESHYEYIPFNQLFGGGPNGYGNDPVYGLVDFPGVTVNYPASYVQEVATIADITKAKEQGVKSVILGKDLDCGTTQLALDGISLDLNGKTLTTNMTHGGISLKNGASIVNGTIEHKSTVAAIKAFNVGSIENVTIKTTCATADKTVTGIAVQQGATVESIKNVTINGVSQGIEVAYQATVGLIENAVVNESNNGTAKGIGLVINGGMVGKAKNCTFKGETYGITLHLKGVFDAGLELENCTVEGTTASIYAWDEKGISNTSGSLVLTYDAATTLTGPFVWDFEDECKSVVTLNKPQ